jgi:hypothetical protein
MRAGITIGQLCRFITPDRVSQASLAIIGSRLAITRELLRENFPIPDEQGAGYGGVNRE